MSKIVTFMSLTLDGVIQAPGRPDEDLRGGFQHGGWALQRSRHGQSGAGGHGGPVACCWGDGPIRTSTPSGPTSPTTLSTVLNDSRKYVASTTLQEPLPWSSSTLSRVTAAVATLKEKPGQDLVILGSGELTRSLMRHDLVDEYVLLIHPLVLGSGRRLFSDGVSAALELADTKTTTTGVLIATYRRVETTAG